MMQLYEARMQEEKRHWEETQQDTETTDEQLPVSPMDLKRLRKSAAGSARSSYKANFATPVETLDGTSYKPIEVDGAVMPNTYPPSSPPRISDVQGPGHQIPFSMPFENIEHRHALVENFAQPSWPPGSKPPIAATSTPPSTTSTPPPSSTLSSARTRKKKLTNRHLAYEAAIGTHLTWADYGGLTSTRTQEDREEEEL